MAVTPEGRVKAKVKALLKEHGAYFFMPVQTGYGAQTLDFLVCAYGFFIGIETKAPGKHPTANQLRVMNDIQEAGGVPVVEHGDLDALRKHLEEARCVHEHVMKCKQL